MTTLLIEDFRHGLDVRKSALTAPAGSVRILDNCVINQGGEVEKRKAFVQVATLPAFVLPGIAARAGQVFAFYQPTPDLAAGFPFPAKNYPAPAPGAFPLMAPDNIYPISLDFNDITSSNGNGAVLGGTIIDRVNWAAFSGADAAYVAGLPVLVAGSALGGEYGMDASKQTRMWWGYHALYSDTTDSSDFAAAPGPAFSANTKPRRASFGLVSQNKVYWGDGSKLHFSSVSRFEADANNPTSGRVGGGLIDLAVNDADAEYVTGLEQYYSRVAVFTRRTVQIWQMDPDPSKNSIQQILKIGSSAGGSVKQFGTGDVLFMADSGVRSLRALNYTLAAGVIDVGSPIDPIIQGLQLTAAADCLHARSVVEPGTGRYWLAVGNKIFVLSYWPSAKISAWSTFTLPFRVAGMCVCGARVYVQDEANNLYLYGGTGGQTYDATVAHVRTPHLTMDKPTVQKKVQGVAGVLTGPWSISVGATADNTDLFEPVANVVGPTVAHYKIEAQLKGTHVAADVVSTGNGPAVLSSLAIDYEVNEKL